MRTLPPSAPLREEVANALTHGLGAAAALAAGAVLITLVAQHGDGWQLALDPRSALRFDWPSGFGVVHELALDGQLLAWREGAGWEVGTAALRVDGGDYAADLRGGLWFQGDGTRPWIGIAAQIDDTPVPAAKKFWIHH